MTILYTELLQWLIHLWYPFMRVTGFFMVSYFFSSGFIPTKVKLILSLCYTLFVSSIIEIQPVDSVFTLHYIIYGINQFAFGLGLGFIVGLFFYLFSYAGQIITLQMGLTMSIMNDPTNGFSTVVLSYIKILLAILFFLALDGHIAVLIVLVDSFHIFGINSTFPFNNLEYVIHIMVWFFKSGLLIASPAISVMLISQISFGFIAKISPSFNIFSLGFPMTMLFGVFAFWLSIRGLSDSFLNFLLDILDYSRQYVRIV